MTQLLVVAAAGAFPSTTGTSTPGCPPLEVLGTVPADDAVVPADVVFRAVVDPALEGCYAPILELIDAATFTPVPAVTTLATGLWRLDPTTPLTDGGRYTFRVTDEVYGLGGEQVTVTVGEAAPPATEAPELTLSVVPRCEDVLSDATARMAMSAAASGLLTVDYEVDGEVWSSHVPVDGQALLEDRTTLVGSPAICASARFEDLAGREVWAAEPACAPAYTCPTYDPPVDVAYTIEAVCGAEPSTHVVADVDLPPADPEATGRLVLEVTTSLSQGPAWDRTVLGADGDQRADTTVLGGHDVCFELVLFALTGEELWRDGPYCSEEPVTCPADARDPAAAGGCGCAGAPGAGGGPLLALVALLSRRRGSGVRTQGVRPGGSNR